MIATFRKFPRRTLGTLLLAASAASLPAVGELTGGAEAPRAAELTETACPFVRPGARDHGARAGAGTDCGAIDRSTDDVRLAESKIATLPPGENRFRVSTRDVRHDFGFWLRGKGLLARPALPGVSGADLARGTTRDFVIEIDPRSDGYASSPNATPNYRLVVEG